ncbi:MAG: family ATPase [Armatimonadetes bacterium]|nr:family ATPase [Armatimonadota bacterium]
MAETLLARAVAADRVGHAYLFLGTAGCGKSTAAKLFAQAMNCERQPAVVMDEGGPGKDEGGRMKDESDPLHPSSFTLHPLKLAPCGQCQSCRRIAAGTHPEVMEVRPESKTGQNITIDQAREIRKNAALRPKLGKRRIYLIPNAEAFNEESANALLKTLEEPSDFVTLLLCAPGPSQVLPTIRSRCQLVRFGQAPTAEIERALTSGGTTPEIARRLANAAAGRPGLALAWASKPSILKQRQAVLDLFATALRTQREATRNPGEGVRSLRLAELLRGLAGGDSEEEGPARPEKMLHSGNLEIALTYLRDLLLLTEGASPVLVQNQERLPELMELAGHTTPERVLQDVQSVRQAQQILDRNVKAQLVLERMFWALICGPVPAVGRLFEEAYT